MRSLIAIAVTMAGVVLAIYAAESNVRLDWAETALVLGVALVTVGIMSIAEAMKGGTNGNTGSMD